MGILILVNGQGGAGKTTVSRLLASQLTSTACFDFDALTCVNPFEYDEPLLELGIRNAACLVTNFFGAGYATVIMSSGTHRQKDVELLLSLIEPANRVVWIWLDASREERDSRRVSRKRDDADNPEWFDFLDSLVSPCNVLPLIGQVEALRISTDGKLPSMVVDELLLLLHMAPG